MTRPIGVVILLALLTVGGCPQPDDPGPAPPKDAAGDSVRFPETVPTLEERLRRHIRMLRSGNHHQLLDSIDRLGRIGEPAVPALLRAIEEKAAESPGFVANALRALVVIGSPKAEAAAIGLVDDPDGPIRRGALDVLGSCGTDRSLGVLLRALWDPELGIVARAFRALERRRIPGSAAAIIERLDTIHPNLRVPAVRLLGDLGEKTAVLKLMSVLESDAEIGLRLEAAKALHALGDERGLARVASDARDVTDPVWAARIGLLLECGSADARGLVRAALASSEAGPREMARRIAMVFPAAGSPPDELLKMLADLEGMALCEGLEQTGPRLKAGSVRVEEFVTGILRSDREALPRVVAARLLVASGRPGALDLVRDELRDRPGERIGPESLAVGLSLALLDAGEEGRMRLREILASGRRVAVLGAIEALSRKRVLSEAVHVTRLLTHDDADIRLAAATTLAAMGTAAEIPALKEAFERESDGRVRRAMADAARSIREWPEEDRR